MHMEARVLAFVLLLAPSGMCLADWAESPDPLSVKTQPESGKIVGQNPPGFSWARAPGATGYELRITSPDGKIRSVETQRNWHLPERKFSLGTYSWRVRALGTGSDWSDERRFSVDASAPLFEIPPDDEILSQIRKRQHPRALYLANENGVSWAGRIRSKKSAAIEVLSKQTLAQRLEPLLDDHALPFVDRSVNAQAWAESLTITKQRSQAAARQLRAAALLWRITGNATYLNEAIRRGDALASLDVLGATSHHKQDQANRAIAWGLTVGLDYLADDLPTNRKRVWLSAIRARSLQMLDDLKAGDWRLEQFPFDSHGATNIGYIAAISSTLIDDIPEAEQWFRWSFRSYVHYQSPWGSEEGGYGNGTAYAEYSTWYFVDFWDAMAAATGVDLYSKPWSQGLLRFLVCFAPPGSPSHIFGDAAETAPSTTTLKAFANRFDTAVARWYSRNLIGEEDALSSLYNPFHRSGSAGNVQAPDISSCLFKYSGWVAMHSSFLDRGRLSLYFKSSRYGSFNHSHGDQNGFVITYGGRPVFVNSGEYDWYGSPHWQKWYRQTKAHNAITFDGGIGQVVEGEKESISAQGRLTRHFLKEGIEFAEGDATAAYGGALQTAIRKVWLVREKNAVVIRDDLSSNKPRTFEWNGYSLAPMKRSGTAGVEINIAEGLRVCADLPIAASKTIDVKQVSPTPPPSSRPKQNWHLGIKSAIAKNQESFIVVFRAGCVGPPAQFDGDSVAIGEFKISTTSK